jgi:hypothetical protein
MKKLGKSAKRCLISGISIALVGAGLYIFNITGTIPIVCIVTGTMCALVGTPYINGIEYPQMIKEQQLQHRIELANKKNYVESNLHKYGIGKEQPKKEKTWDDVLYIEEEMQQYMQMPESQAPFNPETIFSSNEPIKEQSGPRLVKRRIPPKHK